MGFSGTGFFSRGKIWQVVSQDLDVNYVAEMLDKLQDPGGLCIVLKFPSFSKHPRWHVSMFQMPCARLS